MNNFTIHNIESAPEESKPLLEYSLKSFKMIPNLHGILAESPGLLKAYQDIHNLLMNSSFNNEELTVVWQTLNVEHECHYCVPAHTAIAEMMKIDRAIIEALRNETPLPSDKLEVLRKTTLSMARNRGRLTEAELEEFFKAGYENRQLLDIVLGLSHKVISNYVNHVADTPVDRPFTKYAWEKKSK